MLQSLTTKQPNFDFMLNQIFTKEPKDIFFTTSFIKVKVSQLEQFKKIFLQTKEKSEEEEIKVNKYLKTRENLSKSFLELQIEFEPNLQI